MLIARRAAVWTPLFLLIAVTVTFGGPPPAPGTLTGKLTNHDGVRILYLWGTPYERGYAHGRLLAHEILDIADHYITSAFRLAGGRGFERLTRQSEALMTVAPPYEAELRGLLAGIK